MAIANKMAKGLATAGGAHGSPDPMAQYAGMQPGQIVSAFQNADPATQYRMATSAGQSAGPVKNALFGNLDRNQLNSFINSVNPSFGAQRGFSSFGNSGGAMTPAGQPNPSSPNTAIPSMPGRAISDNFPGISPFTNNLIYGSGTATANPQNSAIADMMNRMQTGFRMPGDQLAQYQSQVSQQPNVAQYYGQPSSALGYQSNGQLGSALGTPQPATRATYGMGLPRLSSMMPRQLSY